MAISVPRTAGQANTRNVAIRVSDPGDIDTQDDITIKLISELPTDLCALSTASAGTVGALTTANFAVETASTDDTDRGTLCGATGDSGGTATVGTALFTSGGSPSCTSPGSTTLDAVAFIYTCPEYATVTKQTDTAYVQVGTAGEGYAVFNITCEPATPPTTMPFCRTFKWCTPAAGYALEDLSGTCGAQTNNAAFQATCDKADVTDPGYYPCTVSNPGTCSTTCPDQSFSPVNSGMRGNAFTVQAHTAVQADAVVAAVQAGSYPNVPSWASVYASSTGCENVALVSCTNHCPPAASTLYPVGQTAFTNAAMTSAQLADVQSNSDKTSMTVGDETVAVTLKTVSGTAPTVTAARRDGDSGSRGREAEAAATTSASVTAACGDSQTCCDALYEHAVCEMDFPKLDNCQCGATTATCPTITCSDSSNKSLLWLLLLLLIPFLGLILLSCCIAFCLMRRRKRGWEERQLATFDPEPQPAAPPPPVNVYEDCPQYAHHDGNYSGYSDVQHCDGGDGGFSHA